MLLGLGAGDVRTDPDPLVRGNAAGFPQLEQQRTLLGLRVRKRIIGAAWH